MLGPDDVETNTHVEPDGFTVYRGIELLIPEKNSELMEFIFL